MRIETSLLAECKGQAGICGTDGKEEEKEEGSQGLILTLEPDTIFSMIFSMILPYLRSNI